LVVDANDAGDEIADAAAAKKVVEVAPEYLCLCEEDRHGR